MANPLDSMSRRSRWGLGATIASIWVVASVAFQVVFAWLDGVVTAGAIV